MAGGDISITMSGTNRGTGQMPIYLYEAIQGQSTCRFCEKPFEYLQKLTDPALDACPDCGATVRRMITAANIATTTPSLSEANIGKHGFTQYKRVAKGQYEKTVGKGPEFISDKKEN